jgi:predicted regulator of Ras-like GTPase activity (Roadblock/LC7/MglB family)
MDAQQALADLTEISSQIQAAVVFDDKGKLAGSTLPDGDGFARAAAELLGAAEEVKTGDSPLVQLEVATAEGSVFIVREGKATIAATTAAAPTVGLVFYDLKSALRSMKPSPKRPAGSRKAPAGKKSASAGAASKKKATAAKRPAPRKKKSDAS